MDQRKKKATEKSAKFVTEWYKFVRKDDETISNEHR